MRRTMALCMVALTVSVSAPREVSATEYRIRHVGAVCITRDAYDRYATAVLHARKTRDVIWMKHLYDSEECIRVKEGLRVTIKDAGLLVSQVYIFAREGGAPLVGWTANEIFMKGARSSPREAIGGLVIVVVVGGLISAVLFFLWAPAGCVAALFTWFALVVNAGEAWGNTGRVVAVAIPVIGIWAFIHYLDASPLAKSRREFTRGKS